ncbi:MAG: type I-C CRISPR-associated protein Cas5c [Thermoleophilia bacterium]|nr:type I-C CRISPR-associated protein Cas5c [Thermoleophilia bacterium]
MTRSNILEVKLWGDFACFTRPEFKVERVSYEVMTPAAARGALEAIFWKPEFHWEITEIIVLKPIRHISIVRNEVDQVLAPRTVAQWRRLQTFEPLIADDHRTQRHTLALRDVAYIVRAQIVANSSRPTDLAKYVAQFTRRIEKGQCHLRPYFGCREFAAHFGPPTAQDRPLPLSADLGQMLFDLRYDDRTGQAYPVFFHAQLESGSIRVPSSLYKVVRQ